MFLPMFEMKRANANVYFDKSSGRRWKYIAHRTWGTTCSIGSGFDRDRPQLNLIIHAYHLIPVFLYLLKDQSRPMDQ